MVKRPLTMLQRVLKQYPRFFDKSDDSNNLKFIKGYSDQLKRLETEVYKIELAKRMERPLKIFRNQIAPHQYEMNFIIVLDDIKRVKIYDGDDNLLFDSLDMPQGTNYYSYLLHESDEDNVITDKKYYMTVEDYNETKFIKGFPHNLEPIGDIYDHDEVLDKFGQILGVPRRLYKSDITENDYPQTYPPYCIDIKEWDYFYEQRLKEFVDEYENLPLAALELKKIWGITPTIQGRWRALCFMDESDQDEMFMATDEWDYPVYDVSANLEMIPKNIDIPDGNTIQQVLDRAFPLSKKAYWKLVVYLNNSIQQMGVSDDVKFNLRNQLDVGALADSINTTVTDARRNDSLLFDYVIFGMSGILDNDLINDKVSYSEYYNALYHDTPADFALDTLTNCSVVGTGSSAYVKLDAVSGNQTKTSTAESESSGGSDPDTWNYGGDTPLSRVRDNGASDASAVRADCRANQTTGNLILSGFNFNIPSNGTIVGIQVSVVRRQSGTLNRHDSQLNLRVNNTNKGSNKASSAVWPQSYGWAYYGGSDDTWGTTWTPAEINSSTFGVQIAAGEYSGSNSSLFIDYMRIQVWYLTASGELMTQMIDKDIEQTAWDKVDANTTIPAQCGSDAVLFDVYQEGSDKVKAVFINATYYNTFDVATLQAAGVTDLIVLASRFVDPKYNVTLPAAISRLAGSGIRVHAWITTFRDSSGNFTDPADTTLWPDIINHCLNCLALGVDGIHFDYVRYPGTTGHAASDATPHGFNNINAFLKQATETIKASYPDTILSASVMPEMSTNKNSYGQHYASMSEYLHWLLPMAYTGNFGQPASWVGTVTNYIKTRIIEGCQVIPTLQTYNSDSDTTTKSQATLETEGQYAYDNGAIGLGLFRYGLIGSGAYPFPGNAETLVLSNQTAPFSIASLNNAKLKVKAKLKTADTAYSPQINWIKVIGKKLYKTGG